MNLFQRNKTFRTKGFFRRNVHLKTVSVAFGDMDIKYLVKCPQNEDENEWLAVNVVDFYNQINVIYGNLLDFCTTSSCPVMSAGPKYEFRWSDGELIRKPIRCSAPDYVHYLMNWIQSKLDDPKVFPVTMNNPFDAKFRSTTAAIMRKLFRVYGHIYFTHFPQVEAMNAANFLNVSFKHFVFFALEFKLIPDAELHPLNPIIRNFHLREDQRAAEKAASNLVPEKPRDYAGERRCAHDAAPFDPEEGQRQHSQHPTHSPEIQPDNIANLLPLELATPRRPLLPIIEPADVQTNGFNEVAHQMAACHLEASQMHRFSSVNVFMDSPPLSPPPQASLDFAEPHTDLLHPSIRLQVSDLQSCRRGFILRDDPGQFTFEPTVTFSEYRPKVAIVGVAGWEAALQCTAFHSLNFDVVHVWDPDMVEAESFAQKHGIPSVIFNVQALLQDPTVDIFYINSAAPSIQQLLSCEHAASSREPSRVYLMSSLVVSQFEPLITPKPTQVIMRDRIPAHLVHCPLRYGRCMDFLHSQLRTRKCGELESIKVKLRSNWRRSVPASMLQSLMHFSLLNMLDLMHWLADEESISPSTKSGTGVGSSASISNCLQQVQGMNEENQMSTCVTQSNFTSGAVGVVEVSFVDYFAPNEFSVEVNGSCGKFILLNSSLSFSDEKEQNVLVCDDSTPPMDFIATPSCLSSPLNLLMRPFISFAQSMKLSIYQHSLHPLSHGIENSPCAATTVPTSPQICSNLKFMENNASAKKYFLSTKLPPEVSRMQSSSGENSGSDLLHACFQSFGLEMNESCKSVDE